MNRLVHIFVICFTIATGIGCSQNTNSNTDSNVSENDSTPIVKIEESKYDFGKILQGEKVSHTFTIKNIGNANLKIVGANASCGCTTPIFSPEPIKPGESTDIMVTFDSTGRKGKQNKTITIWTNGKQQIYRLHIVSEVVII